MSNQSPEKTENWAYFRVCGIGIAFFVAIGVIANYVQDYFS